MSERASISAFRSPSRITQSLAFPYPSRHDTRNKHVHYQGLIGLQDFLYGLARIEGSVGRGSALSDQGALNERSSAHIASLLWLYAAKNSALLIESFAYTVCILSASSGTLTCPIPPSSEFERKKRTLRSSVRISLHGLDTVHRR
jgi:hypothetical protein